MTYIEIINKSKDLEIEKKGNHHHQFYDIKKD